MTATWDAVISLIGAIGRLKDPEYYADALRFITEIIGEIHTIDHRMGEGISRSLEATRAMKNLRTFVRKVKEEDQR